MPPRVSSGTGGATCLGRRTVVAMSPVLLSREDLLGEGVRVDPAQVPVGLAGYCPLSERLAGPLGRLLDHDGLDLGAQPAAAAPLQLAGVDHALVVALHRVDQLVDPLAGGA